MSSKSSPCAAKPASSSTASSGERPKYLGRELHASSLRVGAIASRASAVDSEPADSCHKIATVLLRSSRNQLDITQDAAAALTDTHATVVGRRERGEFDLGPLRDWCALLRELVRAKGPEAAGVFMAEFIEAIASRDARKK